ncbi:MAG: glucose-6-phosphate isomerase [Betaproteobacteria bacterium]|nr:glucose-6-phosphate isomerase [Betaproteobacteria bacterium]
MTDLMSLPEWAALEQHRDALAPQHLRRLFADDAQRFTSLSLRQGSLFFDFSKQRITSDTVRLLIALARARKLDQGIRRMAAGEPVNFTENRAALHIALRARRTCHVAGQEVSGEVRATRARTRALVDDLRTGRMTGATGKPLRRVVNLGIGGSDLGPRMAHRALAPWSDGRIAVDYVANVDPRELHDVLERAHPDETLFVLSSKSFSTVETLTNARSAREWLTRELGEAAAARHFVAVSNNVAAAREFGIASDHCFALPEWVGGRYSMWSAIGLPLACALGMDGFEELLDGAREMDEHFLDTPWESNLPVVMALMGIWNTNFLDAPTLAVLPYSHGLADLPAYLQQLDMESNGKRIDRDGHAVMVATAPILWGGTGTVGQHAFHQLLYQGTRTVPVDFIVIAGDDDPAQRILVDNALAQAAALMAGRTEEEALAQLRAQGADEEAARWLAPHLVCPGNQPSSTLLLPTLTPRSLGQLVALYEHKVFVQGWIWGINSYDQYGVELGKQMARALEGGAAAAAELLDGSTRGLLATVAALRATNRP